MYIARVHANREVLRVRRCQGVLPHVHVNLRGAQCPHPSSSSSMYMRTGVARGFGGARSATFCTREPERCSESTFLLLPLLMYM
jgi:hypothetical protein